MKHSQKAIDELLESDRGKVCEEDSPECEGRLTIHRAVSYAGSRIHEPWAYTVLCAKHHGVDEYQGYKVDEAKYRNNAIKRMPEEAKQRYPKIAQI